MDGSSTPGPLCSGPLRRRDFLRLGLVGMGCLSWPGLLRRRAEAAGKGRSDTALLIVWLHGGASHIETYDPKPSASSEYRGPYKPIATAVPGMRLSELHPRLAKLTKHFCLIRSMTHPGNISNHFDAMHNCLSGQAGAPADAPYIGSVLAKVRREAQAAGTHDAGLALSHLGEDLIHADPCRLLGAVELVVHLDGLRRSVERRGDAGEQHGGDRQADQCFDQAQSAMLGHLMFQM